MPETGRFMAEDAFKGDGLNRYTYVRNNPLVFIDPMGLCGEGAQQQNNPPNVLSVTGNILLGMWDAVAKTAVGIWNAVTRPVDTVKGIWFLTKALLGFRYGMPVNDEAQLLYLMIMEAVFTAWNDFAEGDANKKARMIGRLTGEIIVAIVSAKGADKALKAIKASSKSGYLARLFGRVGKGINSADDVATIVSQYGDDVLDDVLVYGDDAVKTAAEAITEVEKFAPLLKTKKDAAFFWSGRTDGIGGADRALEIARSKGGTTLENIIEIKSINMPEWNINNVKSVEMWRQASVKYAQQASGEVRAVIGSSVRTDSVWLKFELPALKRNSNVTKIITIDPETLVETIIFAR